MTQNAIGKLSFAKNIGLNREEFETDLRKSIILLRKLILFFIFGVNPGKCMVLAKMIQSRSGFNPVALFPSNSEILTTFYYTSQRAAPR